jgi:hypothetical protein
MPSLSVVFDPESVRQSIKLFLRPESITELRIPKAGRERVISGYFSDPDRLFSAVSDLNGKFSGIYTTINEPLSDLLARSANTVKPFASSTTGDAEILRRNWLLLDFDPDRPAGISSTDTEHAEAITKARSVRSSLSSEGWPMPVLGDSGNGAHLLYSIELENTTETSNLIRSVLQAIHLRYSTKTVKTDLAVFNASRISKIYGTLVKKGDSTSDRPHRVSRILNLPNPIRHVPEALLRKLAAEVEIRLPAQSKWDGPAADFSLEAFIVKHGIPVREATEWTDGAKRWVLEECPFNPEHKAPDSAIFRQSSGRLGFKCFHDHCAGRGWKEFRALYEPVGARREPQPVTAAAAATVTATAQPNNHTAAKEPEETEEPEIPFDERLSVARELTKQLIDSGESHKLYGSRENPAPYLVALAALTPIEQAAARRVLREKFKSNFIVKEWDLQLRHEIARCQKQNQRTTPYILNDEGALRCGVANAITMLGQLPIAWNSFSCRAFLTGRSPWGSEGNWTDYDDIKAAEWCQHQGLHIPPTVAMDASLAVAKDRKPYHHPVVEYLKGLTWDKEPRINHWLTDYLGVKNDDYSRAVAAKWMISAVRRVFEPGCQADYTIVLEGTQGKRKSTALRTLIGSEWFSDDITDIGSKDSAIQLQGKWVVELAELDAFRRAEITTIKAWLVRREDHFRPPYGRRAEDFPRQNVFAASTNKDDWGMDDTGLRRFWPIRCGEIRIDALAAVRDQLWAEAYARHTEKEATYFSDFMEGRAAEQQDERQSIDVWQERVIEAARSITLNSSGASVHEILTWMKVPIERQDQSHAARVGRCLRIAKWERRQVRDGDARVWKYSPPPTTETE